MESRTITLVGAIATSIWLVLIALYVWARWPCFLLMQPNSLGDFIAGAFGPLALFWLVCGYFQQSIQLKLNTKALTLQTEALNLQLAELRASVFHQREMSAAATEQARLASDQAQVAAQLDAQVRESAEPKLKIVKLQQWPDTDPSKPRHVSFGVLNQGGNAKVIEVDWQRASMRAKGTLGAGETLEISLRGPEKQHKAVREVPFKIRDDLGRESSWLIQLKPVEGIFEVEIARTQ